MPGKSSNLGKFWQELKRRKVVPIFIAYLATCFAVIEFVDITSSQFNIPGGTVKLLYLIAAVGLPVVILLPWFINRHRQETTSDESALIEESSAKDKKIVQHNLPLQLTNFIGRERDIEEIRNLIGKHRIVSLTGAGGYGKTRLACEVAAELLQDYKDGVWFVDLAPITSEDLVVKEITEVLKIVEEPNRTIIDTLTDKIRDKNMLIILDNCEHFINSCAEITGKLIQSTPSLQILTTSREALNIKGEKVWRIPSLTLLDPRTIIDVESVKSSEAVLLFTDRAQLNNPEFELESENVNDVVTICNKLDGIPLALELVANRTRHMNPHLILERLADRFDLVSSPDPGTSKRQKTLQATIEWSYNLLSDSEKILFTRLAAFTGGFDLTAVEEVCADDQLPKGDILDLLSRLVDRSMIYTVQGTDQSMGYNSLEIMLQFARQNLQSSKEGNFLRERHLHYYLKVAEEAYDEQIEFQDQWLDKLESQHDNLMAALRWSDDHSPEEFVRLSGTLAWFWVRHAHFLTGIEYLEKAILKDTGKTENNAKVIFGLGKILGNSGDFPRALELMNESLVIWRQYNNLKEEALVLAEIGIGYFMSGNDETGLKYAEEGLALAREIGDLWIINYCMITLGQGLVCLKQIDRARPLAQQFLVSSKELQHLFGINVAHHFLGDCALIEGNFREAEQEYGLGVKTALKIGDFMQVCIDIFGVAMSVAGQSRLAKAIRLNAAVTEKAVVSGYIVPEELQAAFWVELVDNYIVGTRKKLGEELTRKYEEEGKSMGFEKAVEYALDFEKD